jgi:hypothetical protein
MEHVTAWTLDLVRAATCTNDHIRPRPRHRRTAAAAAAGVNVRRGRDQGPEGGHQALTAATASSSSLRHLERHHVTRCPCFADSRLDLGYGAEAAAEVVALQGVERAEHDVVLARDSGLRAATSWSKRSWKICSKASTRPSAYPVVSIPAWAPRRTRSTVEPRESPHDKGHPPAEQHHRPEAAALEVELAPMVTRVLSGEVENAPRDGFTARVKLNSPLRKFRSRRQPTSTG